MDIDAYSDDGVGNRAGFGFGLDEDAARFAWADEQVVGPANVDFKTGRIADGMGGSETGGLRAND